MRGQKQTRCNDTTQKLHRDAHPQLTIRVSGNECDRLVGIVSVEVPEPSAIGLGVKLRERKLQMCCSPRLLGNRESLIDAVPFTAEFQSRQ
ncbi:MAG: hypothetical protein JWO19_5757 [Bryobacterales bacterium]|jgi:hypothetical protein|nr:hypothetical protein [Bryobacterales bacterium]